METMTVRIKKANFNFGLKKVKSWGFRYDAVTQTWSGKVPMCLQGPNVSVSGYLANASLQMVTQPVDPATTWMGDASMAVADSIF